MMLLQKFCIDAVMRCAVAQRLGLRECEENVATSIF
jgi:hypothetical protein